MEIRQVLEELAERLRRAPGRAEELVLERGEVSDRLHRALDEMKVREAEIAGEVAAEEGENGKKRFPNEAARNAETNRRLAQDETYQTLKTEVEELRLLLRKMDAEIERVSRSHRSDANIAYLVAALYQAGKSDLAEVVLQAYGRAAREGETREEIFAVNKMKPTTKEGVYAVYCTAKGKEVVLYAKEPQKQLLEELVDNKARIKYQTVKGKFLILEAEKAS